MSSKPANDLKLNRYGLVDWDEEGDKRSLHLVLEQALLSVDVELKWNAARIVGAYSVKSLVPHLVNMLAETTTQEFRRVAASSLARIGFDGFSACIPEIIESGNLYQLEGLADALGETADPKAIPSLRQLFHKSHFNVQNWAALGFAKIGSLSLPVMRVLASEYPADLERTVILLDAVEKIDSADGEDLLRALRAQLARIETSGNEVVD